jgi:hypothetical protein
MSGVKAANEQNRNLRRSLQCGLNKGQIGLLKAAMMVMTAFRFEFAATLVTQRDKTLSE